MIRIGTLGAARITPMALLKPCAETDGVEVTAMAARNRQRAEKFARKHGIPRILDDYQSLLDDPDIDAIYNPLPNGLHCQWTLRALAAGKHVLCEKPFCSNAGEARQMAAAAERTGLVLMEAFHYRYHPLMARVQELVATLGRLAQIDARMCIPLPLFNDIRYDYDLGGGASMDVGAYTCHMIRSVAAAAGDPALGINPRVVRANASLHDPRVDRAMVAELVWENGTRGTIINSLWSRRLFAISLNVVGDAGRLRVLNPVVPHLWHRLTITVDGRTRHEQVVGKATYYYQLQAFVDRVRRGQPALDLADSIANMELIDAVYTAAGLPLRGMA